MGKPVCNFKFLVTNANYRKVLKELQQILKDDYNEALVRTTLKDYDGDINKLTKEYVLQRYPQKDAPQEKISQESEVSSMPPVTKIISGGQTGVDTIGLKVAKSLGIETGGTAPKNYTREEGVDSEDIKSYGLVEITEDEQKAYTNKTGKKDPYTGRTELNVRNSDGTVYFHYGQDKAGLTATRRAATEFDKPFLLNPTPQELRHWMEKNNIQTLNVAGNRGSRLDSIGRKRVEEILREALTLPYNPNDVNEDVINSVEKQERNGIRIKARSDSRQEERKAAKWARYAANGQGFEVSSAGDEFGRKFSALAAVFNEGTKIVIRVGDKRKGKEYTFDVGGYSIEAAYQMIKGYARNPKGSLINTDGKIVVKEIHGKGKAPIGDSPLKVKLSRYTSDEKETAEEFSYNTGYLPLWKEWAKQNEDLVKELKKRTKYGKLILTDKFANTRTSQARALAEIMYGVPKAAVSERTQTRYNIERNNAVRATQAVNRAVKNTKKMEGVRIFLKKDNNDRSIYNYVNNLNTKGQKIASKEKFILSFPLSKDVMTPGLELFVNPFENVEDPKKAVNMFIQWIIPNDFNSLPQELRVEKEKRNKIRTLLAKGGYKKQIIVTDGSEKNRLYANTLRYIIDNFEELRERYNPINIQDFALAKHNIRVVSNASEELTDTSVVRFAFNEAVPENIELDDTNSFKIEGVPNTDNYVLSFPENFDSLSRTQKDRMFKTIAMAMPEGKNIMIDAAVVSDAQLKFFKDMVDRGFTRVGDKNVTSEDGTLADAGIYQRNGYVKERVIAEGPYNVTSIADSMQPNHTYIVEATTIDARRNKKDDILVLPTLINGEKQRDSYWGDEDFDTFKNYVDNIIAKAKEKIDEGNTVVIPKGEIGTGSAAMHHYAPRLYQYLQQQMEMLKDYGNREAKARVYFSTSTTTVEAVDNPKAENINLDVAALQSPRARLRQLFTDTEIHDFARYMSREFLEIANHENTRLIRDARKKLSEAANNEDTNKIQKKLDRLTNPRKAILNTLSEVGIPSILAELKEKMTKDANGKSNLSDKQRQKYMDAQQSGIFELIFQYAVPFIEDTGIRINMSQMIAEDADAADEKKAQAEDTDGNNSPEMIWQYEHRLVDPYKALTKAIRNIISNIEMRDPNDLRKVLTDSIGQKKYWDAQYIYHSIMSTMAKMTLGEIDNFMTVVSYEELKDEEKKVYPLGKPKFPVLESMKTKYPWAEDLIKELTRSYNKNVASKNAKAMTAEALKEDPVAITEIGNVASQFYSNFCQQFIPYCIMVNGNIYQENRPTGSASLKQTAINNYQGNVRFEGVEMIYNSDGSVNQEGIEKAIEKANKFAAAAYDKTFWDAMTLLKKKHPDAYFKDMYHDAPQIIKEALQNGVEAIRSCGMNISGYDLFLVALQPERKWAGLGEVAQSLVTALEATRFLPEDEHIFESSFNLGNVKGYAGKKYEMTSFYWNTFFSKFGDYVTEQEYESSFRTLGKSRYSYVYPSYMSMVMINLTNSDDTVRKKYIEENFMPYDWYYDKKNKKFRNKMLEDLYNGTSINREGTTNGKYGMGHDMIAKKDGNKEKGYEDWSPQDIYELMFTEQDYPENAESGNFIIPTLSDSKVCKSIQAPKLTKSQSISIMTDVVKQELLRMDLVANRNIILRMQDIEDRAKEGLNISKEDKEYYDNNLKFYQKYKENHPEHLQEVDSFDKHGSKFCFFPELNDYRLSYARLKGDNETQETLRKIIRVLSTDMNNPKGNEVGLKEMIDALQRMSDSTLEAKASAVDLTTPHTTHKGLKYETASREEIIDKLIEIAIESIMERKVSNFFWSRRPDPEKGISGIINDALLTAILKSDRSLMDEYNKNYRESSKEKPLTPEEEKALNETVQKIYEKARDFYYSHTANMSQFLQLMVTDLAYYGDPNTFKGSVNFAKRFKEVYGAGKKLNTNSKFGKKIERNIIIKDKVRRSHSYNVFEGALDRAVREGRIIEEQKDAILDKMKAIMGTDAQAFRSVTSWRDIMDMIGSTSEEVSSAINNFRNNKWTMKDFYVVLNTLKPFSFGPEDQDSGIGDIRMKTMVQHKNSEAVLFAVYDLITGSQKGDINYSPTLKGINRAMEEIELVDENREVMKYANGEHMKAIDVVQYQSAVKVGAHGVIDINYSRKKLEEAKKAVRDENIGRIPLDNDSLSKKLQELFRKDDFEVATATYYDIEKEVGKLLDRNDITFDEYEDVMDYFEPDEDEVFQTIKKAIYKNGDESLGYDDQVLHKLPYANYCVQQPSDDHYTDNDSGTFGSQPRHIIITDLPDDIEITVNGKTLKGKQQVRERYNSLIVANLVYSYETEIAPLFQDSNDGKYKDKKNPSLWRMRDRLMPLIKGNPKYGKQMEDALQIVPDGHGGETFALPWNNTTIAHQLEELVTSLFKNAIHRQDIEGGNVILAADVGYSKKLHVRGKKDKNGNWTEIEGVECLIPPHLKSMYEKYKVARTDKYGKTYYVLDPQRLSEDGLDKFIGYRIPTEGLYSIMPLIVKGFLPAQSGNSIVVAQEITTLTGSDNDVDKLYLMMKAANGEGKAIKAPNDIHVLEMSKKQRDNEIVEMFYAITTNPKMMHLWARPGNFDTLTREASILQIMKSKSLRDTFVGRIGLKPVEDTYRTISIEEQLADLFTKEHSQAELNAMYRKVMEVPETKKLDNDKSMLDIVDDFTGKYAKPLSPVYPDTFLTMHQTYMAGVAEKGIFANNTLDHAKLQWADVRILPTHTFTFDSRRVEKIDPVSITQTKGGKKYIHYISEDCAECGAASVDNGKKPVLNRLNCTKQTATFYGFLLRLGLGIKGASYLMAQPAVNKAIRVNGAIDTKVIEDELRTISGILRGYNVNLEDESLNWRSHNFTTRELCLNVLEGNTYELSNKGDTINARERLKSLYRTYNLMLNLVALNKEMRDPRTVIHYDSPNHAADSSIGGVIEQTMAVRELNDRKNRPEFERMLSGEDNLVVYNLEEKTSKKNSSEKGKEALQEMSPKYRKFNAIMSTELPITQGFYTLGIEKIKTEIAPRFAYGRPEMQELTNRLWEYMQKMGIYKEEDRKAIIAQFYTDYTTYRLSKTKLFGDDENMTYDQKRQYYLYDFPGIFKEKKAQLMETHDIDALRRLSVKKGSSGQTYIVMNRGGGETTVTLRDFITDSFDEMLQSNDSELQNLAKELFVYTYFLNGFDYSYMSYGNMLSTEFQRAFPEYIQTLIDMNTEPIDAAFLDNFFSQFIVKRNNLGLVPSVSFNSEKIQEARQSGVYNTEKKVDYYGSWDEVPEFAVYSTASGRNIVSQLLQLSPELSELYGTIVYLPIRTNTSLHYNANQTLGEILDVVYDQDKINANMWMTSNKKKNKMSVGYDTYQSTRSQKETPVERDENVPEVEEEGNSVPSSAVADPEEIQDSKSMEQAVGVTALTDVETVDTTDMDNLINSNKRVADAIHREPQEPDIEEAQKIIKDNNDGQGVCRKNIKYIH